MKHEIIELNKEREVTLECYIQQCGGKFRYIAKRPAMVILPGGGYQYCSDREADPVAFAYLKAGFQVFVLRYSVKKHCTWPNPLSDFEQAMELIKSKADEWGIYEDKIAVAGFSAGGHLASAAATMAKNRPNAAILGYAATGEDVKGCNLTAPNTIFHVDKNTCPCFVFATRTDELVPIQNSIQFISALADANVAFESHIYAYGPHGVSTCDSSVEEPWKKFCSRVPNWVEDSVGWLRDILGDFGDGEMTEPACSRYFTDDNEPYLSAGCTLNRIMSNPEGKKIIDALLKKYEGMLTPEQVTMVGNMTLRGILGFVKVPDEMIALLDGQLRKISNE